MECAENKTIVGWSGGCPRKICKITLKYVFSCILEATFSNAFTRLIRRMKRKMKMFQKHCGIKKLDHICEGRRHTKIMIDLFLHVRNNNVHPLKTVWFCFILFYFQGLRGKPWYSRLPPRYASACTVIILYAI